MRRGAATSTRGACAPRIELSPRRVTPSMSTAFRPRGSLPPFRIEPTAEPSGNDGGGDGKRAAVLLTHSCRKWRSE